MRAPGVDLDWHFSPREWATLLATLALIALLSWLAAQRWGQPGERAGFWVVMLTLQFIAVVVFAYRHARLPSSDVVDAHTYWRRWYLIYTVFGGFRYAFLAFIILVVWIGWQLIEGVRWVDRQAGPLRSALVASGFTLQAAINILVPLLVMTLIVKLVVYLLRANLRWREALWATGLAGLTWWSGEELLSAWPPPMSPSVAAVVTWLPLLVAVLAGGWVLGRRARSLLGSPVGVPRGLALMLAAVVLALLLLVVAVLWLGLLPMAALFRNSPA